MQNIVQKSLFMVFIFALWIAPLAFADQIVLTNGDRLTGKIIKSDIKNLVLKSDLAGDITVPWEAVEQIASDDPLFITQKDGKVIEGTISTVTGQFEVTTPDGAKVMIAKETVDAVRSPGEQAIVERLKRPGLFELWTGVFDFGLALAPRKFRNH